jgi:hypothetical protein
VSFNDSFGPLVMTVSGWFWSVSGLFDSLLKNLIGKSILQKCFQKLFKKKLFFSS